MRTDIDIFLHLTYVVECVATDLNGEAKFELRSVVDKLEASKIEGRDVVLEKLREAVQLYQDGDYRHAAVNIVSANQRLQKLVFESDDGQEPLL